MTNNLHNVIRGPRRDESLFDLKVVPRNGEFTFNRQLPFFNWYYPFDTYQDSLLNPVLPFLEFERHPAKRSAAYLHVPFCDTICSFCPFTRGKYDSEQEIQTYIEALVAEIEFKRSIIGQTAVDAIFVGGGTPSVLTPAQIEVLGEALHTHLDLKKIVEFTFELEVKSATREKLEAMQRIGVNRVSFGVQTFSPLHRSLFSLNATIGQLRDTAEMANGIFDYTNVDMIYGMAGQSPDDLNHDIDEALSLKTTTIDFYPLNNLAAQIRMHKRVHASGLQHLSASQRLQYRRKIDQQLRARGYCAINGYSYSRSKGLNPGPIQHQPKFQYHDIIYGYHDDAMLGYGASALTQLPGYNVYNHPDRDEYISRVRAGTLPWEAWGVGECCEKGVVTFPYRGTLDKLRIPWNRVSNETMTALEQALTVGLIVDESDTYKVTEFGWLFYVNLMYYLMPSKGKRWVSDRIAKQLNSGRECEQTNLP
jgi:coproporphyrinogen III oxidase-like Fe-S oxidoreductase